MISGRFSGRDSLLFVYGTLRSFVDIPMARWLRRVGRYVGAARTRGRLYDLGPYPGLRAARGDRQWVVGEVYRVTSPRVWRVLDRYEAGPAPSRARFVRVRCEVWLARGGRRSAFVYLYQREVPRTARIASGDYLLHRRRQR
jgi:gamma-glutamylcyclotransferase (GGCT)/AIG2-like uncharacterized protein YtfP